MYLGGATDTQDRVVLPDSYGRQTLRRTNARKPIGYIRIFYHNRALEWVNIRRLFADLFCFFNFSHLCPLIEEITFAWMYADPLASVLYQPAMVFKKFSFIQLLDPTSSCLCTSAKRLIRFCDPQTCHELSSHAPSGLHVRTMDLTIIQHKELRHAIAQGLNHIPLQPTHIAKAVAAIMQAYAQLTQILNLESLQFPVVEAQQKLHATCLSILKAAARSNKHGFRVSTQSLFDIPAVKNESQWILQHLFCVGLDKASNNACFLCIRHIRLMAVERLNGMDFAPCTRSLIWLLPTAILDQVSNDLKLILPEFPPPYQSLPYLMATYKQHKGKYRWLTNAFRTVFSNIALVLTITSKLLLQAVKTWAGSKKQSYKSFLRVDTSIFWLIDSIIDTTLNLPDQIHDIFVADICRCYEMIPLQGPDKLHTAIAYVTRIAYRHAASAHPKSVTSIWVRSTNDGTPAAARWATTHPQYGNWVEIPEARLLQLHEWLMNNCFITLGDRVWRQCTGIPMGFSCSPIWCNMYLLSYEIQFIQRLARLGRVDLMSKFQHAFRYIDDLCFINSESPRKFLDPLQPRESNNPFWIYPLNVLDIKEETSEFSKDYPDKGIKAHFMNAELHLNESDPTLYSLRKFDKRRDLPFMYTQYIKFHSNRPVQQAYNIVISQVLPILYISNSNSAANDEILCLVDTLSSNGFRRTRLLRIISRFLLKGPFPGSKVDILSLASSLSA